MHDTKTTIKLAGLATTPWLRFPDYWSEVVTLQLVPQGTGRGQFHTHKHIIKGLSQTHITKGLSHSIFFSEMHQNHALPWLPPHTDFNGGRLPQKAISAANTQSFTFPMLLHWKTKQPEKIPYYTLRWGSTAHHLPQNHLLYWLSDICRRKF